MADIEFTLGVEELLTPEVIAEYNATVDKWLYVHWMLGAAGLPDGDSPIEYTERLIEQRSKP